MSSGKRWLGLAVIAVAVSLIIVDSTVVNVAIPSIAQDLHLSSGQVQWVQESYTLVFATLLIPFGTLGDRIGRRRLFLLGVVVFTLASIGAALSATGGALIAARVVQGVGGAMVLPGTMALINASFRGRERTLAFAVWGSVIGGMAAVGPLLGGWLITDYSWQWAFLVNVPFGIAVVVVGLRAVQESRAEAAPGGFDTLGAVLAIVSVGTLVYALIEGRTLGWLVPNGSLEIAGGEWTLPFSPIPVLLLIAALAGVGFVAWERRRSRQGRWTMVPLELFGIKSFSGGTLVAMIVSLGELGILFVLPMWIQGVLGWDALQTGAVLVSLAVGSFLATGMVGGLSRRVSAVGMLRVGIALELAGVVALALTLGERMPWLTLAGVLFVYGLGLGLASSQVTNVVLADVPVERSGQAAGTQSTARQIGSALGIAILGTVLFSTFSASFTSQSGGLPDDAREAVAHQVADSAGALIGPLRARPATHRIGDEAAQSFTQAAAWSAWTAAGFLAVALAASATLTPARRTDESPESDSASVREGTPA